MQIRSRAPLRLGLAGGGSDVSPYCDIHGGYVLNVTIDRYAYAVITPRTDNAVRFIATDKQEETLLSLADSYPLDGTLNLHKAVYNEIVRSWNNGQPLALELSTWCDAPIGSGLGSSSTIVVAMIRAFAEYLNLPLDDYALAHLAFRIERNDCGLQGGRQDQYAATFGGFNFMEFYADDRAIINPLRIKEWIVCELESSLVLFYTGVSRESAKIISDQSTNVSTGNQEAINAMHGIKQEALTMKECLLKGDFSGIIDSMHLGWENKKRSSSSVSSSHIERIYASASEAGALAGKVSGAGGGGFMMFLTPPEKRMDVIRTLAQYQGEIRNCHFTRHGAQAWRIG